MKQHIFPTIKLTVVMIVFFAVVYPIIILGIAQLSPNQGKGQMIEYKGKTYYENIGQTFNKDDYFWSRPSAVDYNAAGSGGSNKGAINQEYLKQVDQRIKHFIKHNPGIEKSEIPMDLVTASGSGLDPNISVKAAEVQVERISKLRNIPKERIQQLIIAQTEKPLFRVFGPEKINVLKLNIALDKLISSIAG